MAERVVVKHGSKTTEFTYGDYQDWNNPLNKVEVLYAGKIAERHEWRSRSRSHDGPDGNGQRLRRDASARQRAGGDTSPPAQQAQPRRLWKLPRRRRGWQTGTRT